MSRSVHGPGRKNPGSSNHGGAQARWRADGKELFYITMDRRLMAVAVDTSHDEPVGGDPHLLFQTRIIASRIVLFQYAVSPDGKRFLINSTPSIGAAPADGADELSDSCTAPGFAISRPGLAARTLPLISSTANRGRDYAKTFATTIDTVSLTACALSPLIAAAVRRTAPLSCTRRTSRASSRRAAPVRFSCSPWAASARRNAAARSFADAKRRRRGVDSTGQARRDLL